MSEKVSCNNLIDFIDICKKSNIDLARITYVCGAMKFVDEHSRFENDEMVLTYKFEELYSDQKFMNLMKYNVLAIINRAYLMYEIVGGDITIWVCYTEEEYRKKGYISRLLKQLIKKHKNTKITIDTFNESLRNICKSLGINLFRR